MLAPEEGFPNDTKAGEMTRPPKICVVLNTSCLKLVDLTKRSAHVYCNSCDFLYGSSFTAMLVYKCVNTLLALYIA